MAEVQSMAGFLIRGNRVKKGRERKQDARCGDGRHVLMAPIGTKLQQAYLPPKAGPLGLSAEECSSTPVKPQRELTAPRREGSHHPRKEQMCVAW